MIIRKPDYFDDFRCLKGSCPYTCCMGWDIMIDEDSLLKYSHLKGEKGYEIKNTIDWAENSFLQKDNRCMNLREDGLCSIQMNLGEEMLCDTCREFPRHVEEYPGVREYSLSLSCPAAVEMIINNPVKADLELAVNMADGLEYDDFDQGFYEDLLEKRKLILSICLEAEDWKKCRSSVTGQFFIPHKTEGNVTFWDRDKKQTWQFLKKLAPADAHWNRKISEYMDNMNHEGYRTEAFDSIYIRIFWALLSVYLPGAVYDNCPELKILFAVFFVDWLEVIIEQEMSLTNNKLEITDIIGIIAAFSRQVEHNDANYSKVEEWISENAEFDFCPDQAYHNPVSGL